MRATKKFIYISAIAASLVIQGFNFADFNASLFEELPGVNGVEDALPVVQPYLLNDLQDIPDSRPALSQTIPLLEFAEKLIDGESNVIKGLYVENVFAYPVTQQPGGQAAYVSSEDGVVTDFAMASKYGVTGLLAHNYLAGKEFYNLKLGEIIQVVYGDGEIRLYRVTKIHRFQALQPNSPNSQFINLETNEKISSTQLFKRVYMGAHHLTMQTCIQNDAEDSWGRLFIIADPV